MLGKEQGGRQPGAGRAKPLRYKAAAPLLAASQRSGAGSVGESEQKYATGEGSERTPPPTEAHADRAFVGFRSMTTFSTTYGTSTTEGHGRSRAASM